jgi:rod shape determining protein RodA
MIRSLFRKLGQIGWSFPIIATLLALCIGSIFVIKSATASNDLLRDAHTIQGKYIIAGFVIYLLLALTPYQILVRLSPLLYVLGVALLIGVFVPGLSKKVNGAYSWIHLGPIGFEPTEFVKLAYILGMAWFLRYREDKIRNLSTVLIALALTLPPFLLIFVQPALGSAAVFFPVCFCMLFAAGARWYYVVIPLAMLAAGATLIYYWFHVWDKPGYVTFLNHQIRFLKPFQVDRVKIFFDPSLDPKGSAWQINQSLIAIGSGGMTGLGLGPDSETAMGFLPKSSSYNDLIFAVVGLGLGFRGGAALIIGEGTVLLWCLWVAARARDKVGALVTVGVMAMLFTHIFVNIGMTIHLVPITGIPLPFVSYGGTFLVACLAAMGLVQSVWVHRKKFERP